MTQFLRDQASDSEEVVTPLMLDGTYLSRNFATLGPLPDSRRVVPKFSGYILTVSPSITDLGFYLQLFWDVHKLSS